MPTKFLILRFSSIGDIVLTTPVVRCLKEQVPGAEVHVATKRQFAVLLENNPYLAGRHYYDGSLPTLVSQLRAERFDYIIDLHNNLRTRLIRWQLGVKTYAFDKLNWQKWLLVRLKINTLPDRHIVDRYLNTVAPLGVRNDGQGLDYFIPDNDQVEPGRLPQAHRAGYVAFAIGGQHTTKKLPLSRLIELCQKINYPVVLLGGREDRATGAAIESALGAGHIYNACGQYNLNQSASLLAGARVVFSHDTGLMHIAAALRKKVYSIWGNTTPRFGMYPYNTPYTVLENNMLACRPCSKIGYNACPRGHFRCMNDLVFDFDIPELRGK